MGYIAELLNELFLYLYAKPRLSDTFFKNSFCTANFPTMRSNSSSFLVFSSSTFLVSNILGAPARNRSFHSFSNVGWQPTPPAISTALFWPFKSSSTARTFISLAIWDLFICFQHSRKQSYRLFPLRGSVQVLRPWK